MKNRLLFLGLCSLLAFVIRLLCWRHDWKIAQEDIKSVWGAPIFTCTKCGKKEGLI